MKIHGMSQLLIVTSFPPILYFVAKMFLKLTEGYVFLKEKKPFSNTLLATSTFNHLLHGD